MHRSRSLRAHEAALRAFRDALYDYAQRWHSDQLDESAKIKPATGHQVPGPIVSGTPRKRSTDEHPEINRLAGGAIDAFEAAAEYGGLRDNPAKIWREALDSPSLNLQDVLADLALGRLKARAEHAEADEKSLAGRIAWGVALPGEVRRIAGLDDSPVADRAVVGGVGGALGAHRAFTVSSPGPWCRSFGTGLVRVPLPRLQTGATSYSRTLVRRAETLD